MRIGFNDKEKELRKLVDKMGGLRRRKDKIIKVTVGEQISSISSY